ncbi:MAG: cell division protein FtsQ/DivIB [Desulfurivibrionaceae bacterium]
MVRKRHSNLDRRKQTTGQSRNRKTLIAIVIGCVAFSFLFGGLWFVFKKGFKHSVVFKIDQVDIDGCSYVSPKEVLALTGLDVKSSMWEVRVEDLSEKLEGQNWIEEARIEKDWPDRIRIIIKERSPRALTSKDGKLFYVDGKGMIFAPVLPGDDIDLPLITVGRAVAKTEEARKKQTDLAFEFIRRATRGNPDLPSQNISEIHLSKTGLIMFLADYPFPIYLGITDMDRKHRRLSKVLSWLYNRQKIGETDYIDMDYMAGNQGDGRGRGRNAMVVFKES